MRNSISFCTDSGFVIIQSKEGGQVSITKEIILSIFNTFENIHPQFETVVRMRDIKTNKIIEIDKGFSKKLLLFLSTSKVKNFY